MTDDTAEALTAERIADTWRQVLAEVGEFERCDHTRVEFPDGTVIEHGDEVLGVVIGATEVVCEAGTSIGRVAVDGNGRIVGLLIVPEGTTDLPF